MWSSVAICSGASIQLIKGHISFKCNQFVKLHCFSNNTLIITQLSKNRGAVNIGSAFKFKWVMISLYFSTLLWQVSSHSRLASYFHSPVFYSPVLVFSHSWLNLPKAYHAHMPYWPNRSSCYERTDDTKTKVSWNAYPLTFQKCRSYNLQKPFLFLFIISFLLFFLLRAALWFSE